MLYPLSHQGNINATKFSLLRRNDLIYTSLILFVTCEIIGLSSVQFSHSVMSDSLRPHELQHARPPCTSPTPGFTQTHVHWVGDAIQPSSPLSAPSPPPSNFPSIRVFSNESALSIRWPKYWSFSYSISPSKEHQDWSPLGRTGWISLQSKGLSRVFSNTSSKASILWCSAFFTVQFSHPYMTTGKTIALTRWTFDGKVISLLLICCLGWS